jgi:hypothetical protein
MVGTCDLIITSNRPLTRAAIEYAYESITTGQPGHQNGEFVDGVLINTLVEDFDCDEYSVEEQGDR